MQSTSIGPSQIRSGSYPLPSLVRSLSLVDPLSEITIHRTPFAEPGTNDRRGRALWNEVHNDLDVLMARNAYNSAKLAYRRKINEAARKRFDARYRKGVTTAPSKALPSRSMQPGPRLPPLQSPSLSSLLSPVLGPVNDIARSQEPRRPDVPSNRHIPSAIPLEAPSAHPYLSIPFEAPRRTSSADPSPGVLSPLTAPPPMTWTLLPLHRTCICPSPHDVCNAAPSSV
ncbi:hypothetical protein BS47DRAFT_1027234 [Hydnum rufescens UP504]|uniref:Uncharacterized protein n=1 Tax=Hydnum rufescens UP504 TaxID=1448309 RepID=A0A9P6DS75_9AGAM|nr:hypothetical protein BS47DRAFT_1027234 [Hydnum rufescens UP504]